MILKTHTDKYAEPREHPHGRNGKHSPVCDWRRMQPSDHFVQFYEGDAALVDSVSGFIGTGLQTGENGIVIATPAHREAIETRLQADGLDLVAARAQGQYIALDAAETLSSFMCQVMPDPRRFQETVGRVVTRAAEGGRRVRAFGEMVALLWTEGNQAAAIRLEELWNELAQTRTFCLYCAYCLDSFGDTAHTAPFTHICTQHSRVIPAESYAALSDPDERLREITLLQQKAKALEAELAYRKQVEHEIKEAAIAQHRLAAIVESSDDAIISKTLDAIITSWNKGAERIFGYTAEEAIGKPKTILFPLDRYHEEDEILAKLRRGERIDHFESVRVRKDGRQIDVSLSISPIRDSEGQIVGASSIARDITEAKQHQRELAALNAHLKQLMTETHHRVKNNLQIVAAMIEMQTLEHKGSRTVPLEEFERLKSHVSTLAIVHDLLTQSLKETEDAQRISIKAVLDRLLPMLQQTAWKQTVRFEIEEVEIPSKQCVSLALVINELVTNALKHGKGAAEVTFAVQDEQAVLEVCDDGPGFPAEFDPITSANTGLELVESLVRTDLVGRACYENRTWGGGRVRVTFALPDLAP